MAEERRINIIQGEYRVSDEPDMVITTLLGSCVAACLYDPAARVGGMNHFLLPGGEPGSPTAARYGVHLMELLVNGLLKKGAARDRLQAKLFGGARTMQGLSDIGAANGRFARQFLEREAIAYTGGSLGGQAGRRLQFWPTTGRVRQLFMGRGEELPTVNLKPPPLASAGDLELF
jgi:chemotaxis protein CheD